MSALDKLKESLEAEIRRNEFINKSLMEENARLKAQLGRARNALEPASHIPHFAYGDNEAACVMENCIANAIREMDESEKQSEPKPEPSPIALTEEQKAKIFKEKLGTYKEPNIEKIAETVATSAVHCCGQTMAVWYPETGQGGDVRITNTRQNLYNAVKAAVINTWKKEMGR